MKVFNLQKRRSDQYLESIVVQGRYGCHQRFQQKLMERTLVNEVEEINGADHMVMLSKS